MADIIPFPRTRIEGSAWVVSCEPDAAHVVVGESELSLDPDSALELAAHICEAAMCALGKSYRSAFSAITEAARLAAGDGDGSALSALIDDLESALEALNLGQCEVARHLTLDALNHARELTE